MTKTLEPRFGELNEAEQKLVAERLLKLKDSKWRPFWCKRTDCDGLPHGHLGDKHGMIGTVPRLMKAGPNGEPLGEPFKDHNGKWVRPILDPEWAHNHARADQRLPSWKKPWTLFIMSGRGSGKTTTGVEFVTLCARKGLDGAIVGRRGTELTNTHVATIIARAHPEFVPVHYASKDILEWPNGAITYLFSAERPENIRSVNLSYFWFDEAAWMDEIKKAWANAKFAARVKSPGNPIHILITSTPTPTEWTMMMDDDPKVEVRRVSTYANRANLDDDFISELETEYEGTRIGRQEIHGEVLRDVEGAMWNDDMFDHIRVDGVEYQNLLDSMDDRVLAVDPAGSKGPRSDSHGIVGVGAQHFDENDEPLDASRFYVLGDATIKGTPSERSEMVFKAARLMRVNRIVVEKNFGGEDVKQGLVDFAKLHPETTKDENGEDYKIELKHTQQSKESRAEPTVGKYEQGRVKHVTSPVKIKMRGQKKSTPVGDLSNLEKEQVNWIPKSRGGRSPSPNRIDALVWAMRALETKVKFKATTATSTQVMAKMKRPGANGPTPANRGTRVSRNRIGNTAKRERKFPTKL